MKKTAIALLTFAAVMFAASCQKENITENSEINPKGEGMTICAVSEGIGLDSKADMVYKYDVVWRTGDKICVKNTEKAVEFTLSGGEGTTKGIFSSDKSISGEVEGFYPSSIVTDGGLMWPAKQQSGQICPMYSKKNLSSTKDQTFSFASLGSVLQIVFNTAQENVTLKSIEIKDGSATLSGAFTVDADGKASITATDKAGITLDLGESGVALGKGANFFNIAVPAGNYQALTLTFTATDGAKCVFNDGKLDIKHNTVGKLVLTGKTFKPDLPAGALPGVFSVSATKKVHFSQGNLWYGKVGSATTETWNFEPNQYEIQASWNTSHVSHFYWSKSETVAYAETYSESGTSGSDVFFTNAEAETAKADFTVNGVTGKYRTLSTAEWQYLINKDGDENTRKGKYKYGVTVCEKANCLILVPDECLNGYSFDNTKTSYSIEEWATAEAAGLVCLPAAGSRSGSNVIDVGDSGRYWSSSADGGIYAYRVSFASDAVDTDSSMRRSGYSVRLITESK